jgi:DNA-binding transcriptional ArsR family regulator
MTVPEGFKGLRFACECVSSRPGGYCEPWATVAKHKLLPDGTKEEILNLVAQEPRTISQVAGALGLSAPSVHTHVSDMLRSELLREAVGREKSHPAERYYEPNFPVVRAEEREQFEELCGEIAGRFADLFGERLTHMERIFSGTDLAERGWEFADLTQYLYACVQRAARERLEGRGALRPAEERRNGVAWSFWAEEPAADGGR